MPARVLELLPEQMARVEMDGAVAEVNIALVDALPGDTIFVHADVAIAKLTGFEGVVDADAKEAGD
jgi:hydrogenase maturation factor